MLQIAADENFDGRVVRGLTRLLPELDLVRVQDNLGEGTPDGDVLAWAAREDRVILTHDKATMTAAAWQRVRKGESMRGLIEASSNLPKIKLLFPQRPYDALADSHNFRRLPSVFRMPAQPLGPLEPAEVDELLGQFGEDLPSPVDEVRRRQSKCSGRLWSSFSVWVPETGSLQCRRRWPASRKKPEIDVERLVPEAGFEPARPCGRRILSPLRLPFRHSGRVVGIKPAS
jgi:hypothetical protein